MCNGSADALDILIVSLSVGNEKREKQFILLSSLSAVFQVRSYPTSSVFRRCVSLWKVHNPPGQACSVEMLAWQAAPLCLDLHYTHEFWLDAHVQSWSAFPLSLAAWWGWHVLLIVHWASFGKSFIWIAFWLLSVPVSWCIHHRPLNSVKVHQVVITKWGYQTEM